MSVGVDAQAHRGLRDVLGSFATGVTVITGYDAGRARPIGITINSFCSVSLEPALVLWSLAQRSPNRAHFEVGRRHAIHILSHGQQALAQRFATPMADKFAGLDCEVDAGDPTPRLKDCAARLACETLQVLPAGDHVLILARVLTHERGVHEPLVFARGSYRALREEVSSCG